MVRESSLAKACAPLDLFGFRIITQLKIMSLIRKLVYQVFRRMAGKEMSSLEADCKNPRLAQLRKLREIVSLNKASAYGVDHRFSEFADLSDSELMLSQFRDNVPIADYEAHRPYINRIWNGESNVLSPEQPFMFATTSGTMAEPKYIPVTDSYIREFRHASVASGYFMLEKFPGISNGITLSVFSPAQEGQSPGGIPFGAISGGLYTREPWLVKKFIAPIPYEVYLCKDYETKYYSLLRSALVLPVANFYTLNPSTIVVLLKRLDKYAAQLVQDVEDGTFNPPGQPADELRTAMAPFLKRDPARAAHLRKLLSAGQFTPDKIWPTLQVVCCWTKASAAFYIKDFNRYFGKVPIIDISYGASEGRGSLSMGDGRQLLSIRSHFFEFVPEECIEEANPPVLLADELELGKNYYILFTSSAGLYRYHINDVIRVVGFHHQCPLIEFQYKGGNVSSFTGEKLTELQITDCMRAALASSGMRCRFFTVLPEFNPNPHYQLLFEPETGCEYSKSDLQNLLNSYELELCRTNVEYKAKRDSMRLDAFEGAFLPTGSYEALRKEMTNNGVADAQIKLSHLNPKANVRTYFSEKAAGDWVSAVCKAKLT